MLWQKLDIWWVNKVDCGSINLMDTSQAQMLKTSQMSNLKDIFGLFLSLFDPGMQIPQNLRKQLFFF